MDSSFSVWDIKLNLSGLSQHRGHVWSYVRAYQCVEDVSEIPLFQRHVLHSTPLPFPLCPQERLPAVFLVFIEQEVDWTGWPGSVFRRLVAETGLGPEPIVLYLATTEGYFCYCCLILSDIVRLQQRNVCVCACSCFKMSLEHWAQSHGGSRRPPYFHRDCSPALTPLWKDCLLFHSAPQK